MTAPPPKRITQLPLATSVDGTETIIIVQSGVSKQIQIGEIGPGLAGAVPDTRLVNTVGGQLTGGGALSSDLTLGLDPIVSAGTVGGAATSVPVFTYDQFGRVTTATTVTLTATDINAVTATRAVNGTSGRITGGGFLSADQTFDLATVTTGATVGSSSVVPVLTYDDYGRITTATTSAISITATQVSGLTATSIGAVTATRAVNTATGQLTGGGTLAADLTIGLATVTTGATVGSSSVVPVLTYDDYGRITTATTSAISITATQVSGTAVTATRAVNTATGQLTGGGTLSGDLTIGLATVITGLTVGSGTLIPVLTIDDYGRVTTATTASASGGVTNGKAIAFAMIFGG